MRVIIVSGGASGIGEAICETFIKEDGENVKVICGDVNEAAGNALEEKFSDTLKFIKTDCGDGSSCKNLIQKTIDLYGQIDVLVNNVGVQFDDGTPTHLLEDTVWDKVLDINLKSYFRLSKHVLRFWMEKNIKGTAIVNIGSVQGLQSQPGIPAYASTKGAILSLTRQMAVEYAPYNIRVNAVNPGTIATQMVKDILKKHGTTLEQAGKGYPINRIGEPEEVANVVYFLASNKASFITGESITVDGGIMALGGWAAADTGELN
jgi:NAD(P)-dependent dehydrogenase (short-subunit alcohol dehydrogenase family)